MGIVNIKWDKFASVTKGGKPYFYYCKIARQSYWVVWDRYYLQWEVRTEVFDSGSGKVVQLSLGLYGTERKAQRALEKTFE